MALKAIKEEFHTWHGGQADSMVSRAMQKANQKIFCVAQTDPELFQKMQTTLTIVALKNDSLILGHVGDCRLYRMRDGHIDQLTRDHTMASDMLQLHMISSEQASTHPGRHQLTRSVGGDPFMNPDITRQQVKQGDTYLLCSDGLWSELTDEEIRSALQEDEISRGCEKLVRLALSRGAPDNITGIMFHVDVLGEQTATPFSWRTLLGKS
jgi:protein phosphatase